MMIKVYQPHLKADRLLLLSLPGSVGYNMLRTVVVAISERRWDYMEVAVILPPPMMMMKLLLLLLLILTLHLIHQRIILLFGTGVVSQSITATVAHSNPKHRFDGGLSYEPQE